jgi:aldehyde dehydrogenase (NAD+)
VLTLPQLGFFIQNVFDKAVGLLLVDRHLPERMCGQPVATEQLTEALLYVDGAFKEARQGGRFDVLNPADETVCGSAADGGADDVADAVGAARRAFDATDWSMNHELRHRCMVQLQESLARQAERICATLQAEAGTPAGVLGPSATGPVDDMSYVNDLIKTFEWQTGFPAFEMLGRPSRRPPSGTGRRKRSDFD